MTHPVLACGGAVASSHHVATEAGLQVLRRGGNAVDAAAAVHSTLGVVEPLASGFGGGAFWLIYWHQHDRTYALDAREVAPAAATADMFLDPTGAPGDDNERAASGLAVGVPGAVQGLEEVLRRFGTADLEQTLQPAIAAAENGVPVSAFMAGRLGLGSPNNRERLALSPTAAAAFLPGGAPLRAGVPLLQPDLGSTLRLIAHHGSAALTRGALGKTVVDEVRSRAGRMTLEDMSAYRPVWREPLITDYRGWTVATFPPPGSGASVVQMLELYEAWIRSTDMADDLLKTHALVEIMRCAYADRRVTLGDPGHIAVPVDGLLDPGFLAERSTDFRPDRALESWSAGEPWRFQPAAAVKTWAEPPDWESRTAGQTTHFTVADRWGNVVAVTATIESLFGSGIIAPGTGLLLNNQMSDFSETPRGPNQVRPGARPASSMAPTIVFARGRPVLTAGSPGGATIAPTIVQVLLRAIDDLDTLEEAVAAPRLFAGPGRRVTWEEGIPPSVLQHLRQLGHLVAPQARSVGNVQSIAIDWDRGVIQAVADPRRQGSAVVLDPL